MLPTLSGDSFDGRADRCFCPELKMSTDNANCDGEGPHAPGEVRWLTDSDWGKIKLCRDCWRHEFDRRVRRNRDVPDDDQLELPDWDSGEIYQ